MQKQQTLFWFIWLVGFSYPEWATNFYAGATAGGHRLIRYAACFNAVEINTTFYGIPSIDTVRQWAEATPAEFRFCVKMPRGVTHGPMPPGALAASDGPAPGHLLRENTLAITRRFMETLRSLGNKLGAVLLQFPPKFTVDRRTELATFLNEFDRGVPLAVELRHNSWWTPETKSILQDRGVCWAATDESPRHRAEKAPDANASGKSSPRQTVPTADFLYVRWLGKHGQFADRSREHFDPTPRLQWWAARLRAMLAQNMHIRTVYAFFDNDFAGHAPTTARRFADLIGHSSPKREAPPSDGPTLFDDVGQ